MSVRHGEEPIKPQKNQVSLYGLYWARITGKQDWMMVAEPSVHIIA